MSSIIKLASGKETVGLKQYIREYYTNNKIGLLVCINNPETNIATIGWSLTSPLDVFDREVAHNIAVGRAVSGKNSRNTPYCLLYDIFEFQARCQRYYKDSVVNIAGILPMTKEEFHASDRYKRLFKQIQEAKAVETSDNFSVLKNIRSLLPTHPAMNMKVSHLPEPESTVVLPRRSSWT